MGAVQELCMETGTITRTLDLRRLIPIHKIADKVGPVVCNTLPAVTCVYNCETGSSFFGVGKKTVWQLAMELPSSELSGLDDLGGDDVTKATGTAKGFVVKMYDRKNKLKGTDVSLNTLRVRLAVTKAVPISKLPRVKMFSPNM